MDNAIEQIKILSQIAELHLVIELSPDSLISTIVDFSQFAVKRGVYPLSSLVDNDTLKKLSPYLNNLENVYYAFYPSKQMLGISNITTVRKVINLLKSRQIEMIHFDTTSGRFMPAIPFLYRYKIVATIHDPIPHLGEYTIKRKIVSTLYRAVINKYLFYSYYATVQFLTSYSRYSKNIYTAKLLPYTYINTCENNSVSTNNYILYFGRLSYYKGIDILLNALDEIWTTNPDLKVIIAGKRHGDIHFDLVSGNRKKNITYLPGYIKIDELYTLIKNSMFVVCPYREATQSGVLMTVLALHKPVLATSVGSFSEYIQSNVNGLLSSPTEDSLANAINALLHDEQYKKIERNMKFNQTELDAKSNLEVYKKLYEII